MARRFGNLCVAGTYIAQRPGIAEPTGHEMDATIPPRVNGSRMAYIKAGQVCDRLERNVRGKQLLVAGTCHRTGPSSLYRTVQWYPSNRGIDLSCREATATGRVVRTPSWVIGSGMTLSRSRTVRGLRGSLRGRGAAAPVDWQG
jgi:hypothetical protein